MKSPFTFDEVASVLRHENGVLYWAVNTGTCVLGKTVGTVHHTGYLVFNYRKINLLVHRVVWLLTTGEWPASMLDHINGVRTDNRPCNLRLCTPTQNAANRRASSSGFKGVALHKKTMKFQVTCARRYIGLFGTEEEAAMAYDDAARKAYGSFAYLNFPEAA